MHCSTLQFITAHIYAFAPMTLFVHETLLIRCSVLQCVAVCCSVLQCVAVCPVAYLLMVHDSVCVSETDYTLESKRKGKQ